MFLLHAALLFFSSRSHDTGGRFAPPSICNQPPQNPQQQLLAQGGFVQGSTQYMPCPPSQYYQHYPLHNNMIGYHHQQDQQVMMNNNPLLFLRYYYFKFFIID